MSGFVGLAFDYKDQPVIAYAGADSKVWIAYDPVEIPEPLTLALLSVGMVALLRRRRA